MTFEQCEDWMKGSGFQNIQVCRIDGNLQFIVGFKNPIKEKSFIKKDSNIFALTGVEKSNRLDVLDDTYKYLKKNGSHLLGFPVN